jgi:putative hydroxymethylpyrimidine transport system substrate-binding protein
MRRSASLRSSPAWLRRLALLAALAAALAGCGEKSEPTGAGAPRQEPFTVMLDYFPNADHAGLYAAQAAGLYEKAGLAVKLQAPPDPSAPLKLLSGGRADVAISYEPELLLARDKGAEELIAVGALAQTPLTSLMWLPAARLRGPEDLAGKRVATAGLPYQSAYLKTILERAGVDPGTVKETNVNFALSRALLTKRADATLGSFWNYEGVELERLGRKPVILRMEDLGVPTYNELIFVTRRATLDAAGASRLRRFLSATAAGHRLLREDPAAAVDGLLEANEELDRGLQTAVVEATLPVFFPRDEEQPWGWQEPVEWAAYERWMRAEGLIKRPQSEAPPLTNEFLPGEGLGEDSRR